jgi:ABC-type bacteriocin/lantibiotic exporter with double-glycine peptidase domain
LKDLRTYVTIVLLFFNDRGKVAIAVLFAMFYGVLVGMPIAMEGIGDDRVMPLAVWAVVLNLLTFLNKHISLKLANDRVDVLRKAFVNSLVRTGVAENDHLGASSRIWLNASTMDHISAAGAAIYGQLITGLLVMAGIFVAGCYVAGWAAFSVLPLMAVLWWINSLSNKRVKRNFQDHHAKGRMVNAELLNMATNHLYYRATGLFTSRAELLYSHLADYGKNVVRIRSHQQVSNFINQSAVVLLFLLLANGFISGLSVGQVLIGTVITFEVRKHLLALFQASSAIFQGGLSYSKIADHLSFEPEEDEAAMKTGNWETISSNNLSFRYPGSEWTHRFGPFTIARGDRVWIQGRNGAGKTTLWKLMLGFYNPASGEVRFAPSGTKVVPSAMRLGIVTEPVLVLPGILWEFLGSERMSRPEVEEAVTALGFFPFMAQITDGFDHVLGMEQKRLSKGQTKVIMFLQAIISKPEVLVLDEPFASVDAHWHEQMTAVIAGLPKETTVLLISHQPAALHFDTTIRLD